MNWRDGFRYGSVLLLLYIFYDLGMYVTTLAALGVMMALFLALRGTIYGKVSSALDEHVPHTKKLPGWLKYAVTLIVFLLIFIVLKEIAYAVLYYAGLDVKGEMFEAMNRSLSG